MLSLCLAGRFIPELLNRYAENRKALQSKYENRYQTDSHDLAVFLSICQARYGLDQKPSVKDELLACGIVLYYPLHENVCRVIQMEAVVKIQKLQFSGQTACEVLFYRNVL
jgi:hypothetical protein